jgi:hypothetical protein
MPDRLLDRQAKLLEHLTSTAAIFGTGNGAPIERTLLGINENLLHLEARFSHEKRMQKIEWVLPRTIGLLGSAKAKVIHDFVEACPPVSISRVENARQFHSFLSERWLMEAPEPPYLPDVAACELAYAGVRDGETQSFEATEHAAVGDIRRHPSVVLLRCSYDVRSILEGRDGDVAVTVRDTPLAVSMPNSAQHPTLSELSPALFGLLEMFDDPLDPDALPDLPEVRELITELTRQGLLQVCR